MQQLLLVNPRKRGAKRRKAASPAQKRARAAFAARSRARTSNPAKRRTKRRVARRSVSVMSNPRKRRSLRRRRNPLSGGNGVMSMLTPALMGAVGAATVNTLLARLPLPPTLMTGNMRYVTQIAAALGLAIVGQKMGKGALTRQMAEGSLTVTLHGALVDLSAGAGLNLSGMGYYLPGVGAGNSVPSRSASPAMLNGMRAYVNGPGSGQSNVMPMQVQARRSNMRGMGF